MDKTSEKLSPCPTCKKKAVKKGDKFFPFCSERCKLVDLGSWLDGRYVIPDKEQPPEE